MAETKKLREKHTNILLTLDGFGAHCTFATLQLLRSHGIITIGLPAHTSHRLQVLDYTVFSPFKTEFRNGMNRRALIQTEHTRNDVYLVCEMLKVAYYKYVTFRNIVAGFKSCGLWDPTIRGVNHNIIRASDITNVSTNVERKMAFQSFKELVETHLKSVDLLESDTDVMKNGILNTSAGALLTSRSVLNVLAEKNRQKQQAQLEREERVRLAEIRKAENASAEKAAKELKEYEKSSKIERKKMLKLRPLRRGILKRSRLDRRMRARLLKFSRQNATDA